MENTGSSGVVDINTTSAILFVVIASCFLIVLYKLMSSWFVELLVVLFCIGGVEVRFSPFIFFIFSLIFFFSICWKFFLHSPYSFFRNVVCFIPHNRQQYCLFTLFHIIELWYSEAGDNICVANLGAWHIMTHEDGWDVKGAAWIEGCWSSPHPIILALSLGPCKEHGFIHPSLHISFQSHTPH